MRTPLRLALVPTDDDLVQVYARKSTVSGGGGGGGAISAAENEAKDGEGEKSEHKSGWTRPLNEFTANLWRKIDEVTLHNQLGT